MRVAVAVLVGGAADDVVAEHALHVDAGRLHLLGQERRPVEALLFAGDGGEHDGRLGMTGGEQTGQLHDHRDAGAVVVGAGRVGREVHDVGAAGVVVPGDDVGAVGFRVAVQGGDDVGDHGGRRYARR